MKIGIKMEKSINLTIRMNSKPGKVPKNDIQSAYFF